MKTDRIQLLLRLSMPVTAMLVLTVFSVTAFNQQSGGPHIDEQPCESCHLAGDKTTDKDAALLTTDQKQLCISCHPASIQASHPAGVQPSMTLPEIFPADWKGDLNCSSCHWIHKNKHGAMRTAARGREFCTACHNDQFFERMADGGISLMTSAHLDQGQSFEDLGIDPFTAQCLSCHSDSGEGSGRPVSISDDRIVRHTSGTNHPVSVDYDKASQFGGYRRKQQLPDNMLLPSGLVSCVSCHLGFSQDHGAVVTKMKGSDLCFQCHDL
ncbi:MAG: cytochrome c3 family protein [Motiliproteus sp.]